MNVCVPENLAVSHAQFREAMSRVVAAVHIVTSDGVAGLAGITANAVTSVSDSPPSMLVCVNKTSHSAPFFRKNGVFCINTLSAQDQALAEIFSGRTGLHLGARFRAGAWRKLASGAPVLASAIAVFDCRITEIHDVATHHIMIGEVVSVYGAGKTACLAYHDRAFISL